MPPRALPPGLAAPHGRPSAAPRRRCPGVELRPAAISSDLPRAVQECAAGPSGRSALPDPQLSRPAERVATIRASPLVSNNVLGTGTARGATLNRRIGRRRSKLRVAVDVDEVLGRFLHSLNKFCLEEYNRSYDVPDYFVYEFAKIWNCSKDESNHIVHEFFKSHHFAVGILPIPGALHSLQRLGTSCDLVVVTSRQHCIQEPTLAWIEQHYPGVFSAVHFGNHWALEGTSRRKSEICRDIGASVLIDDNPQYALECAEAGLDVLLYDWQRGYPWATLPDGGPCHARIQRVADWTEVEVALATLAAAQLS